MPATAVSIRGGEPSDWRPLRMLLPDAVYFGSNVIAHVAEDDLGRIVGAIAVGREVRPSPVPGLNVALHVVAPFRASGVEERLLLEAEADARSRGLGALYTWGAMEAGADDHRFWQGLGFDRAEEVLEGRTDVARGLEYLEPFWQELVARGKVPGDVRVVPLNEADPGVLARLYVAHIGGSQEKVFAELTGESPRGFDPRISPVILVGDRVAACILARRVPGGVALVEAVIVDVPFRGRWANLLLRRAGWRGCAETGIHTVLYYTHGRHKDTRRFVEKVGTTTREFVEPYRTLAPGPAISSRAG